MANTGPNDVSVSFGPFVTHMWLPVHPQYSTTNNHDNHKNCTKNINNSSLHNHYQQSWHNHEWLDNGPRRLFFLFVFFENTKQHWQLLWTYWSYRGARRRQQWGEWGQTMPDASFGPFSEFFFSHHVFYMLTIIEKLWLWLYEGIIRRLQRGKQTQMKHLVLFGPFNEFFKFRFVFFYNILIL